MKNILRTGLFSTSVLGSACAFADDAASSVSTADNGFVMICAALVILMSLPGIGLFYGGLVRAKNMLSVLVQSLVIFALIFVLWTIYGYTLSFGTNGSDFINGFMGNFDKFMMFGVTPDTENGTLSDLTFFAFQGAFAAISSCLIIGALAERIKFSALIFVIAFWFTFSYIPLCHMVWGGGYIDSAWHAYDFAGGTVVHINAAVCALVGAVFLGKRIGFGRENMTPHSLVMTMIGASLLWIGWFGFNAGSELVADGTSALAFANTVVAPSAATLAWLVAEWVYLGKPSLLGACSGAIAGLVAITPACAFVGVGGAMLIGAVAGVVCLWSVHVLKRMLKVDDALDVFGVHGVGGIIGALLSGVFCAPALGGVGYKEGWESIMGQFTGQFASVVISVVWCGVVSVLAFYIAGKLFSGIRVPMDEEREGLDLTSHGERAYNLL
ncbi:ammonium transporter [Ruminobacter sp.]|uniref:ammonium transporter n=1 Tax=Ruminobacter sp. TaxID=2774296 RepID=UPI0038700F12